MITNRQLPRNPVTWSAMRAPSVARSMSRTLTGCCQVSGSSHASAAAVGSDSLSASWIGLVD
jgi:hypothetical protein